MTAPWPLVRGRVYEAVIPPLTDRKYFVVVSNNRRNAALPQALAVRLTTSPKPTLTSVVELDDAEGFTGRAVCDDIVELYQGEVRSDLGALSPRAMAGVRRGLMAALDL